MISSEMFLIKVYLKEFFFIIWMHENVYSPNYVALEYVGTL